MNPNTFIYLVNKPISFYILKFTMSKYKPRLHLKKCTVFSLKPFGNCRKERTTPPPGTQDSTPRGWETKSQQLGLRGREALLGLSCEKHRQGKETDSRWAPNFQRNQGHLPPFFFFSVTFMEY
jgi:hypothetical protein